MWLAECWPPDLPALRARSCTDDLHGSDGRPGLALEAECEARAKWPGSRASSAAHESATSNPTRPATATSAPSAVSAKSTLSRFTPSTGHDRQRPSTDHRDCDGRPSTAEEPLDLLRSVGSLTDGGRDRSNAVREPGRVIGNARSEARGAVWLEAPSDRLPAQVLARRPALGLARATPLRDHSADGVVRRDGDGGLSLVPGGNRPWPSDSRLPRALGDRRCGRGGAARFRQGPWISLAPSARPSTVRVPGVDDWRLVKARRRRAPMETSAPCRAARCDFGSPPGAQLCDGATNDRATPGSGGLLSARCYRVPERPGGTERATTRTSGGITARHHGVCVTASMTVRAMATTSHPTTQFGECRRAARIVVRVTSAARSHGRTSGARPIR